MTRSGSAIAMALLLGGCLHSLAEVPPLAREPRPTFRRSFAVHAGHAFAEPMKGVSLGALLEARLRARGAVEVVGSEGPAPGRVVVEAYLVASRPTPLSRWTGFPWGLVTIATLGIVPLRGAIEHVLEIHAVDPAAAPGHAIRVARRSYVESSWVWLPLVLADRFRGERSEEEQRRVNEEGLARAIDAALDEVLGR